MYSQCFFFSATAPICTLIIIFFLNKKNLFQVFVLLLNNPTSWPDKFFFFKVYPLFPSTFFCLLYGTPIYQILVKPGAVLQTPLSLIDYQTHPFPPLPLRCCHAKTVGDRASSHQIDYVAYRTFQISRDINIALLLKKLRRFY